MKPSRLFHSYRFTALLLAVGVGSTLGIGPAQPWHRHLLEGLQLFHSHSHLGGHHHEELHALAEDTHRPDAEHALPSRGQDREPEEDEPPDSDCRLIAGGSTDLERSSATFAAPVFVPQRREALRPTALFLGELVPRPGARAPPT